MIYVSFGIKNPFWDWSIIRSGHKKLTKNKTFEWQIDRTWDIIGFTFNWRTRQDHAGPSLDLSLMGYEIIVSIADNRHWDNEKGTWYEYENV